MNDQFSEKIVNSVSKLNFPSKILIILAVLASYLIIFILTIMKFNSFNTGEEKGTIINNDKRTDNIVSNTSITNTITENTDNSEEFDINDYVSEKELREAYNSYYANSTDITYAEFRELVSSYLYYYLYENN